MERDRGVSGISSTQEQLEQASESKASLDEQKGEKLNDMSAMVLRLNEKIAQRKAKLAPIIKGQSRAQRCSGTCRSHLATDRPAAAADALSRARPVASVSEPLSFL